MKRLLPIISLLMLPPAIRAQNADAPPEAPKPVLTPDQVNNVLKQLADLEKSIMQQRGTNLGSIIQKLHSAASSDAAAINFVESCDKLVNVERKDGDRQDAKKIEQKAAEAKRGESKKEEEKDGDHAAGVRLCLEYLALTLEAHDAPDLSTMIPKVQSFHNTLISHGKKLKGRTGELLMRGIGGGGGRRGPGGIADVGVVVEAYQLDGFLRREGWPLEPGNIVKMYQQVILKPLREKKKEDIGAAWDTGLNLEATFRKVRMAEGDFSVWQSQDYPALRWTRALDLADNGSNAVTGMAEMLKVIKENPAHSSAPDWIKQLRDRVTAGQTPPAAPAPAAAVQ